MGLELLFADDTTKDEFLVHFEELAHLTASDSGLEGFEGGLRVEDAEDAVALMREGSWTGQSPGLEAIIRRFTRPVHLVQQSTFRSAADGAPESTEVSTILDDARSNLDAAIPSVGRIDLANHRLRWAGTGWLVGDGLVATARHVAQVFAETGGSFAFRHIAGRTVRAELDCFREFDRPEVSTFRVRKVEWIEPDASMHDVAFLRLAEAGLDGQPLPAPIELLTETATAVGAWVATIGYPGNDSRAALADRQRIFDGIYDCKRLAAGRVTAIRPDGIITHDATTLGGNSGSVVVDLATGKATGLHFAGDAGLVNSAVHTSVLARLISEHVA